MTDISISGITNIVLFEKLPLFLYCYQMLLSNSLSLSLTHTRTHELSDTEGAEYNKKFQEFCLKRIFFSENRFVQFFEKQL